MPARWRRASAALRLSLCSARASQRLRRSGGDGAFASFSMECLLPNSKVPVEARLEALQPEVLLRPASVNHHRKRVFARPHFDAHAGLHSGSALSINGHKSGASAVRRNGDRQVRSRWQNERAEGQGVRANWSKQNARNLRRRPTNQLAQPVPPAADAPKRRASKSQSRRDG